MTLPHEKELQEAPQLLSFRNLFPLHWTPFKISHEGEDGWEVTFSGLTRTDVEELAERLRNPE